MGNKQNQGEYVRSHSGHFGKDFLLIQTLKPTNLPAETVEGKVYLLLNHPCDPKSLTVCFKGKVSAAFRDFELGEPREENNQQRIKFYEEAGRQDNRSDQLKA